MLIPHKDNLFCASYRPISLNNSDIKILAKNLARRLNDVVTALVGSDQTGFISGHSTYINLWRLFTNMQATHDHMGSRLGVALDTHKAFNSVEWPYLYEVLAKFGFGPSFIHSMHLLYSKPSARILYMSITISQTLSP